MPTVKGRACTILGEFERAETELVGKADAELLHQLLPKLLRRTSSNTPSLRSRSM